MGTGNKLWNKNFIILWQGQFISDIGNAVFNIILSLWVYKVTKSTAMMGSILACLSIPRVFLGPFTGAFADRHSRKWIIVIADLVRGILFAGIGLMAVLMKEAFPLPVLYPAAILSGICSAFFSPAITSALPDIVPLESLTKANTLRTLSSSISTLVGNSLGGILFALLNAPPLILGYGACFLYASVTQFFMRIPKLTPVRNKRHILHDMIEGMRYTFSQKGIRTLIITGMFLNFFAVMGVTLLAPLFIEDYSEELYGTVMAMLMVGSLIGMALVSLLRIKAKDRPLVFYISVAVLVGGMIPIGLVKNVIMMFPLALLIGAAIAVMTILVQTLVQITVQPENRGKVFGIMSTVFEGLNPVSMAASGVIASIFKVRPTIVGSFVCAGIVLTFIFFNRTFRAFLKSEPIPESNGAIADDTVPPA